MSVLRIEAETGRSGEASPPVVRRAIGRTMFPYLLLAPTVGLLCVFTFYPLIQGFWMAFFKRGVVVADRVPATWPKYVGFHNFTNLLGNEEFLVTLAKTVGFVCAAVPLLTLVSLVLALLLKPAFRGVGIVRAVVFFPSMVSLLIIGITWKWMLGYNSGIVNYLLSVFNVAPVPWLESDLLSQIAVVLVWVWANAGFFMMIFIAGLTTIPETLYEAALVDGTSRWRTFCRITLPLLAPTVALVVILSSVEAFKVYELVLALTAGGPGRSTVYLIQLIYETAFNKPAQAGIAAAQSLVLFVILFVLTIAQLRMARSDR
ncbi:MAG: sugar ABC transporter permease [Azospirillaceae bacterium]|nr:sugar ABC transporter permease [Azospirillaceae bacterium]